MSMKVVLASKNKHKLEEISKITEKFDIELILQSECGVDVDVEENGTTFEENAMIKAKTIAELTGEIAMADDSGLEIDAFGGEPGIYSARYLGHDTIGCLLSPVQLSPYMKQPARGSRQCVRLKKLR